MKGKAKNKNPRLALTKRNVKTWGYAYLFIAPTVLGVLILNLWGVIQSFYYSFHEVKGFNAPIFIGLDNYVRLFSDKEVWISLKNVFVYAIITVPIGVMLSLLLAVLLNAKIKGKMRKRDENKTQFDEKRRQFQENYVMSTTGEWHI